MSPWLELSRAAVADVRRVLEDLPGRSSREPVVGTGLGGDETTAVDAAAEAAIVARLAESGRPFTLVSEELGEKRFGGGDGPWIVLDPIDGSLNAKRGIPFFLRGRREPRCARPPQARRLVELVRRSRLPLQRSRPRR